MSSTSSLATTPTGRFVWFEYVTTDRPRAEGFFGELFHWTTMQVPMPQGAYAMLRLGPDGATIGGYLAPPPGAPTHAQWMAHLQVASAAESAAAVKAHGGKVEMAPFPVGDFGTMAVVRDPLGGVFALWQPTKAEGTGDFKGVPGAWCWNELLTADPAASVAFYQAIGGFTDAPMDMGPAGTYHVLTADGKPRAGVMKAPMADIPQLWMPYVQVADTDATFARALRLGATARMAPYEVPSVGRLAIFADPQGAPLGILQPPAA
jgi:predicted enzyme related to lactoylglutathione lyase